MYCRFLLNIQLSKQINLYRMTGKEVYIPLDPFEPMCAIVFRTYATYSHHSSLIMESSTGGL